MSRDYANLQRKPFLMPIWLSFLSALIAFCCLCFATWAAWLWITADATTIIVVPAADSEAGDGDPPLTPMGEARAQHLAELLGMDRALGRIELIYTTASRRSRMTAAPLASRLKLTPIELSVSGQEARSSIKRMLREHAGGRVLIVGERDIVPEIIRQSGYAAKALPVSDMNDGALYIIAAPSIGRANLLRLSY